MVSLKCKICGGTLEIESGATIGTCEFCGTKQTLPKTTDEKITNLFNRANNLRLKCDFDKAMSVYEKIVEQDDSESEAHWGIVLCRYGIEYVEDKAKNTRIPTCHRTLYEPVTKDVDFQAAIDFADAFQQAIYEKEARVIDKIQKDILAIVQNESPFDVFICYKEKDEDGKRTKDSVFANDIYYQLTQEGFKVFFAAITLEDKLGQEYEPYIFAALNTAKVMLVIGSKPEYFESVWVKNEWSRFMNLMKTDRTKMLIPCYRDMDAYDLPEEFVHLQAQDMGKIGFINDIIRGIKKIIPQDETPQTVLLDKGVRGENVSNNTSPLLERAYIFLEDGKWKDADSYFEKVLDKEPKNVQAYLGKLLTELNIKRKEDLITCKMSFRNNDNYNKVIRFGDESLKNEIESILKKVEFEEHYCQLIKSVNENRVADNYGSDFRFEDKLDEMESVAVRYDNLAEEIKKIGEYKDSGVYLNKCVDESTKIREKIKSIKISSEEERVRIEKEEFDKHYCQLVETVNKNGVADDYGSDFHSEDKIDEMERLAVSYDNLAEEIKKIGDYKESRLYLDKCTEESNKIREKVENIKKSCEEERIRKEEELDKYYYQLVEKVNGSRVADDYGSDFHFENKISEMEKISQNYDNLAKEFKKILEYKEAKSYQNKCSKESYTLKEKIKSIRKSIEDEKKRVEGEEKRKKVEKEALRQKELARQAQLKIQRNEKNKKHNKRLYGFLRFVWILCIVAYIPWVLYSFKKVIDWFDHSGWTGESTIWLYTGIYLCIISVFEIVSVMGDDFEWPFNIAAPFFSVVVFAWLALGAARDNKAGSTAIMIVPIVLLVVVFLISCLIGRVLRKMMFKRIEE